MKILIGLVYSLLLIKTVVSELENPFHPCDFYPPLDGISNSRVSCFQEDIIRVFKGARTNKGTSFEQFSGFFIVNPALAADLFGLFKFQMIKIEKSDIKSMDINTFSSCYNQTTTLQLNSNRFDDQIQDGVQLMNVINKFTKLEKLEVAHSNLLGIPDDAFKSSQNLKTINLNSNRIASIGKNAFLKLEKLILLDLNSNKISTLSANTFALNLMQKAEVDLSSNHISKIENNSFKVSGDRGSIKLNLMSNYIIQFENSVLVPLLRSGRITVYVGENPFSCECKNKWITQEANVFEDPYLDQGTKMDICKHANKTILDACPADPTFRETSNAFQIENQNSITGKSCKAIQSFALIFIMITYSVVFN